MDVSISGSVKCADISVDTMSEHHIVRLFHGPIVRMQIDRHQNECGQKMVDKCAGIYAVKEWARRDAASLSLGIPGYRTAAVRRGMGALHGEYARCGERANKREESGDSCACRRWRISVMLYITQQEFGGKKRDDGCTAINRFEILLGYRGFGYYAVVLLVCQLGTGRMQQLYSEQDSEIVGRMCDYID